MVLWRNTLLQAHLTFRPPSLTVWWLCWGLVLLLDLAILIDTDSLDRFAEPNTKYSKLSSKSELTKDDWVYKFLIGFNYFDPSTWLKSSSSGLMIYIASLFLTFSLAQLLMATGVWSKRLFGIKFLDNSYVEGVKPNRLFFAFRTLCYFPEILFLLSVMMVTRAAPCVEITKEYVVLTVNESVSTNLLTGLRMNPKEVVAVSVRTSYISREVSCGSIDHVLLLIGFGGAAIVQAIMLQFSHKLMSDWPSPSMPMARNSITPLVHVWSAGLISLIKLFLWASNLQPTAKLWTTLLTSLALIAVSVVWEMHKPGYLMLRLTKAHLLRSLFIFSSLFAVAMSVLVEYNSTLARCTGAMTGMILFPLLVKVSETISVLRLRPTLPYSDDRFIHSAVFILSKLRDAGRFEDSTEDHIESILSGEDPETMLMFVHIKRLKEWARVASEDTREQPEGTTNSYKSIVDLASKLRLKPQYWSSPESPKSLDQASSARLIQNQEVSMILSSRRHDEVQNSPRYPLSILVSPDFHSRNGAHYGHSILAKYGPAHSVGGSSGLAEDSQSCFDTPDALMSLIESIAVHRLNSRTSSFTRDDTSSFVRITNMLLSIHLEHTKDIFKSASLIAKVMSRANQADLSESKLIKPGVAFSRQMLILKYRFEDNKLTKATSSSQSTNVRPCYGYMLDYIETFIGITIKIKTMLDLRKEFASVLLDKEVDARLAFKFGEKFTLLNSSILKGFRKVKSYCPETSTPYSLVELNYRQHVLQDEFRAAKQLREVMSRKFRGNMERLVQDDLPQGVDLSIIICSLQREDFQLIKIATANLGKSLQFDSMKIIGKSILELIPNPIKTIHSKLCDPASASSRRVKSADWLNLPVKRLNGYITRMPTKVMISFWKEGLQAILILRHKPGPAEESSLIVDDQGSILEAEEDIGRHLMIGTSIREYSEVLHKILRSVLLAQQYLLTHGVPTSDAIAYDGELLLSYRLLLALRLGQCFSITLDQFEDLKYRVRLTTLYQRETRTMMRMLLFTSVQDTNPDFTGKTINLRDHWPQIRLLQDLEYGEDNLLEFIKHVEQSAVYLNSNELGALGTQRSTKTLKLSPLVKQTADFQSWALRKTNEVPNDFRKVGTPKQYEALSPSPKLRKRELNYWASEEVSSKKLATTKSEADPEYDRSSYLVSELRLRNIRSELLLKYFQDRILDAPRTRKRSWCAYPIILVSFAALVWFLLCLHVLLTFVTRINFARSVRDFNIEIPGVDALTFAVGSNLQKGMYTLFSSAARTGTLPQDFMKKFFPNETLTETIQALKIFMNSRILKKLFEMYSRHLRTSHSFKEDIFNELIWKPNIDTTNDEIYQHADSPLVARVSFFEYLKYYTSWANRYSTSSEELLPPEEAAKRDLLHEDFYQASHGTIQRYLNIIVDVFTSHLDEKRGSLKLSMLITNILSTVMILVVALCLVLGLFALRLQVKLFYSKYFYLKKKDIEEYQAKLTRMDPFWDLLLGDQFQTYKTGRGIYNEKKTKRELAQDNTTTARMVQIDFFRNTKTPLISKRKGLEEDEPRRNAPNKAVKTGKTKQKVQKLEAKHNTRINYSSKSKDSIVSMSKAIICFFAMTVPMLLVSTSEGLRMQYVTNRIDRFVHLFTNTLQLSKCSHSQASILANLALRPNESTHGLQPIGEAFKNLNEQMSNEISKTFKDMLGEDLGNFTKDFKYIMTGMTVCQMINTLGSSPKARFVVSDPNCASGNMAFMNTTLVNLLQILPSRYAEVFNEGIKLPESERHLLTKDTRWVGLMQYQIVNNVIGAVYYLLLLALSPALADLLKFDGPEPGLVLGSARDKLFFSLQIMLLAVGAVILLTAVVAPAERTLRIFRNTCLLLPWRLALQNPLLSHHFRR